MNFTTSFSSIARALGMRRPLGVRRNHGLAGDCRGVAAVEFGILLPFLVILLAGIADLGRSIWQYQSSVSSGCSPPTMWNSVAASVTPSPAFCHTCSRDIV